MKVRSRKLLLMLVDIIIFLVISAVYFLSAKLIEPALSLELYQYIAATSIFVVLAMASRTAFGIYASLWRYTGAPSYLRLCVSDTIGAAVSLIVTLALGIFPKIWFFVIVPTICLQSSLMMRLVYHHWYRREQKKRSDPKDTEKINVAIVGAGSLGAMLLEELEYRNSAYKPVLFIDKDPTKVGSTISDIMIYRNDAQKIPEILKRHSVKEIFITISSIDNEEAARIFDFYSRLSYKVKIYDIPVKDLGTEDTSEKKRRTIREFQIEDLLFRKTVNVNDTTTKDYYKGKTVLVTGGGGSIGSELCRQIAKCSPKKLVILDIYENNAYEIQQELVRKYGDSLDLSVEIASVRDRVRLENIFKAYRPNIVFHAAAHKHVPLMEHSASEAIKNNVFGTQNTADMAEMYASEKFILISTDKAVNPTNIMGASKRLCEMAVQCRTDSKTSFASVRFGNVLGSNGSVIPLFKNQIAAGGPVTITDKRIVRYFMTIPEASQLVMQAGAMAKKGELFVLDMGKPVQIYDLAVNMIKLSGLRPEIDIKIEEIGLRPGEKLYEELLIKTEALTKTENSMIFIEKDTPISREEMDKIIDILGEAVSRADSENASDAVKKAVKEVVATFREPEEINRSAENAEEVKMAMSVK